MIAGIELPESGCIEVDGHEMNGVAANERPINMMFQSYAVFPHMNVFKNIAYGLIKQKTPKNLVKEKVSEMIKLVQLDNLDNRMPNQLSGGQLQRVALGRALIKEPKLLLLDEPLAALDKKLREQTQFELINLKNKLDTTFIVVTHDQEEAMTLSSRIALMDKGQFVQIGVPSEIYETPINKFAADFFGSMNFFAAEVISHNKQTNEICAKLKSSNILITGQTKNHFNSGDKVTVGVRPEKLEINTSGSVSEKKTILEGQIEDLAYYGNRNLYRIKTNDNSVVQVSSQNVKRSESIHLKWKNKVFISWENSANVFLKT